MKAIGIIPARYHSTRLPAKPLIPILGKPLIQWVYERACQSNLLSDILVATDNDMIFRTVIEFGAKAQMTSSTHASGTDRVAEVAQTLDADFIVNIQGDEPLITGKDIDHGLELLSNSENGVATTLVNRIERPEDLNNPNICKVVVDKRNYALYFSRAPIPYFNAPNPGDLVSSNGYLFKHIGVYFYKKDLLLQVIKLPKSHLEQIENLEQLRLLENGFKIKVAKTDTATVSVDTPADLKIVEKYLSGQI
jgi:3-deoxy-manno-octulosonate cytidylyltransferase (CMP-KDO synthetase)